MSGGGGGGGGGLGLTLQQLGSSESLLFPCRRRMMMMVRSNHDRAFHGDGGDGHGPTTGTGGAEEVVRCMSDTYDVAGGSVGSGGGGTVVVRTPLQQPFDISSSTPTTTTTTTSHLTHTFKSPGAGAGAGVAGGMAASLGWGFPFTIAQWNELERQAMIYKYMMASVPVPAELLFPISRNFSDPVASPHSTLERGSIFNLRFSNGTDPEPGRCRRTDGKKWRCSRDVAPNQKYCERHMHRGRPRSRKPVELRTDVSSSSHKKTRHCHPLPAPTLSDTMLANTNTPPSPSQYLGSVLDPYQQTPVFLYKSDPKIPPFPPLVSVPSLKDTRSMEWTAKGGGAAMAASDHQWQQLMRTKIGLTLESSVFSRQYQEESINSNSYTDFVAGADHVGRDSTNMFLNPEAVSLHKHQTETPRAFIDAWSSAVTENPPNTCNKTSASSDGKLPLSSLTLSMGGGSSVLKDEMGSRIADAGCCGGGVGGDKPQLSTWLSPAWAGSSTGSALGGPLAEVLRPSSSAAAASNPASPHGGNADSISPSETAASSPSGVLQKPLVSPSDSSGNSSPSHLSGSQVKPGYTFPWLNQGKVGSAE